MLKARILSLNVGLPRVYSWQGRSIETSMVKAPIGALQVDLTNVVGDRFANPKFHGTPDSVLYAYASDAVAELAQRLGRTEIPHGVLGENLSLDHLDEREVSVGDIFQIGSVRAQATFPRIPCAKINAVLEHPDGQKAMIESGRSGVYFRILTPGLIEPSSTFECIERARVPFSISEVYERMVGGVGVLRDDVARAQANGAFPAERLSRWESQLR